MKTKTAKLGGVALDWAVAESVGADAYLTIEKRPGAAFQLTMGYVDGCPNLYSPSTDWAHCGPLIERHNVELVCDDHDLWTAIYDGPACSLDYTGMGDSPMPAACRAIVAAKLGNEVDVPEGLV